jgi:hypothetical protein
MDEDLRMRPRGRFRFHVAAVVTPLVLAVCACSATPDRDGRTTATRGPASPSASVTLALTEPRAVHRATLLADGSVLFTGGCTEAGCGGFDAGRVSDVYDPATRRFITGPVMLSARASGTATVLADGRVLLTGGYPGEGQLPTAAAELYDPVTGRFESVGSLVVGRADQSATLLPDGTVMVAGGFDARGEALLSTEVFDPTRLTFDWGPPLSVPRAAHVAVAVGDRVVLVGGTRDAVGLAETDVLQDGRWSPGPRLHTPRVKMGAAWIGAGRVLVVGGATDVEGRARLASSEVLDLSAGRVSAGPDLAEGEYKLDGAVVRLGDGRVAVAGGRAVELYDPRTNAFAVLAEPPLMARSFRTATQVGPDLLLVAGGYDDSIRPTSDAVLVRLPARS